MVRLHKNKAAEKACNHAVLYRTSLFMLPAGTTSGKKRQDRSFPTILSHQKGIQR